MVLTSVSMGDSGQYLCYAANPVGNASTLAKIVVDGKSIHLTYANTAIHLDLQLWLKVMSRGMFYTI